MSKWYDSPQVGADESVCVEHAGDDEYLAGMVRELLDADADAAHPCAVCAGPGARVADLMGEITFAVHKFFERAINSVPYDEGDWALPVIDSGDVLSDLGLDSTHPLFEAALTAIDDDGPWVSIEDGWPNEHDLLRDAWRAFSEHVMHRSRFLFDVVAADDEWGGIDRLGTQDFLRGLLQALQELPVRQIEPDTPLYRARSFPEEGIYPKAVRDYTSAPTGRASQGRMNPAGIAYFYGAFEPETAAVEVYNGNDFAAVATFTPQRMLTVVDLSRVTIPSPFDRSVSRETQYRRVFLRGFARDIARPIVRDERIHQEYVPTQAVTEFIRFSLQPSVDGIAFASARTRGTNVVLFADQEQCLGGSSALLAPESAIEIYGYGPPSVAAVGPAVLE